jgi:hypothetical protein
LQVLKTFLSARSQAPVPSLKKRENNHHDMSDLSPFTPGEEKLPAMQGVGESWIISELGGNVF